MLNCFIDKIRTHVVIGRWCFAAVDCSHSFSCVPCLSLFLTCTPCSMYRPTYESSHLFLKSYSLILWRVKLGKMWIKFSTSLCSYSEFYLNRRRHRQYGYFSLGSIYLRIFLKPLISSIHKCTFEKNFLCMSFVTSIRVSYAFGRLLLLGWIF